MARRGAPWGRLELDGPAARRAADVGHRSGAGRGLGARTGGATTPTPGDEIAQGVRAPSRSGPAAHHAASSSAAAAEATLASASRSASEPRPVAMATAAASARRMSAGAGGSARRRPRRAVPAPRRLGEAVGLSERPVGVAQPAADPGPARQGRARTRRRGRRRPPCARPSPATRSTSSRPNRSSVETRSSRSTATRAAPGRPVGHRAGHRHQSPWLARTSRRRRSPRTDDGAEFLEQVRRRCRPRAGTIDIATLRRPTGPRSAS